MGNTPNQVYVHPAQHGETSTAECVHCCSDSRLDSRAAPSGVAFQEQCFNHNCYVAMAWDVLIIETQLESLQADTVGLCTKNAGLTGRLDVV